MSIMDLRECMRLKLSSLERPHTFHGFYKERYAFLPEVIGSDGNRVTGNITTSKPSPFQNGNIGNTMIFSKVIGRGETMPPTSNNNYIITLFSGHYLSRQVTNFYVW